MFPHESDGIQKILLESIAKAVSLLVEVRHCLVNLCLGGRQETNLHHLVRALRLAKTSSAGIASTLPAL